MTSIFAWENNLVGNKINGLLPAESGLSYEERRPDRYAARKPVRFLILFVRPKTVNRARPDKSLETCQVYPHTKLGEAIGITSRRRYA